MKSDVVKEWCAWVEDEPWYATDCGNHFEFIDDNLTAQIKSGFRFCPYCGKPIEECDG